MLSFYIQSLVTIEPMARQRPKCDNMPVDRWSSQMQCTVLSFHIIKNHWINSRSSNTLLNVVEIFHSDYCTRISNIVGDWDLTSWSPIVFLAAVIVHVIWYKLWLGRLWSLPSEWNSAAAPSWKRDKQLKIQTKNFKSIKTT